MMKFRKLLTTLITAGLVATLAGNVQAGMYKWVDKNGNTVYSQQPPEDIDNYETIKGLPGPKTRAVITPSNEPKTLYPSVQKKGSEEETESGNSKEDKARRDELRAKNCESAKKHLDAYTVYRRFPDKDGKMVVVTEQDRQKKISEAKEAIKEFCD